MMLTILAESALRSLVLGSVVWIGLNLLRVRNPHVHMTSWVMVLVASLSMPLLMHWTTVSVTVDALPVPAPEALWPAGNSLTGPLTEPLGSSLPPIPARPSHQRRQSHRRQLVDGGDRDLRIRRRTAAAATGGRLLSDLAPGARRKADE